MNTLSPSFHYLPRARVTGRALLWSGLTGLALALPLLGVVALITPAPANAAAATAERLARITLHPGMLALQAMVIYPAIEETFYRGLLLPWLARRGRFGWAVAGSTLLFAATHLGAGLGNAIFALGAGGYFVWLTRRSGSLFPSILCHAAVNCSGLFFLNPVFGAQGAAGAEPWRHLLAPGLLAASVLVLLAGMRILRTELAPRPAAVVR